MAKKLSKTQKAKNKSAYKAIRREYEKVKDKAPVSYIQFKRRVKARAKSDNMTIKSAAKREARTETFLTAAERSRENILSGIKTKHREVYDEIRELNKLNRDRGRFQSIKANLTWDTERKGYILNSNGKNYFIDVSNSPEDVKMTEIK